MIKIKRFKQDKLSDIIHFSDVVEGINFMKLACDVFTNFDHHPDVFCLRGKKLSIELTTHSSNGITDKDTEVMKELLKLIGNSSKPLNPNLF